MEHEITRGADCLGTSIPHHLIRSYSEVFYELRYNGGERGRLHRLIIFRRDTIVDEGPTAHAVDIPSSCNRKDNRQLVSGLACDLFMWVSI